MSPFLTTIKKLSIESNNDSIVGDVFIAKPKSDLKIRLGTIAGVLEIFEQPDEFSNKLFEIIEDLETEYYLPPFDNDGGVEQRFEECLQRANRRINKAINDSPIEIELKNINVLLLLINKNKIYFSQIGKNNAFLFHRQKKHSHVIIDIFSQAGEKSKRVNPEKMFSNIINGTITEKDSIFICNDSILEYLSQNELMEIITDTSSGSPLKEIQKILETQNSRDVFYALSIHPVIKEDTDEIKTVHMSNEKSERHQNNIPSQTSINKLISTQEDTERYLAPSMVPNWKKALIITSVIIKKIALLIYKYSKLTTIYLINLIKRGSAHKQNKSSQAPSVDYNSTRAETNEYHIIEKQEEKIEEEIENENITQHQEEQGRQPRGNRSIAERISDKLNAIVAWFVGLRKLRQALLIMAVILIFFFSQSMVWQGMASSMTDKLSVSDKLSQIDEYINTGEAKNIFNDEEGAKKSLADASELMAQIPDSRKYEEEKRQLQIRIDDLMQSLQKIVYLDSPIVISDLQNQNQEASISSISKFDNLIFAFDNQNQNIYQIDLDKKQTISRQLASNFNNVSKIVATDKNNIILLNNTSEFYRYNLEKNEVENIVSSNEMVNDFGLYGGKLYTLRSEAEQINRHIAVGSGFNSGSRWLKSNLGNGAVAMTIDGGIYTIDTDGSIKYFASGNSQVVDFSDLAPPLSAPKQIFSDIKSNFLYVLDQNNNRLVILNKNSGDLKIQYTSKEFSNMQSMVIEESEDRVYILSDNKIYLIETGL